MGSEYQCVGRDRFRPQGGEQGAEEISRPRDPCSLENPDVEEGVKDAIVSFIYTHGHQGDNIKGG